MDRLEASTTEVTGFTSYRRAVTEALGRHYEGSLGNVASLIWEHWQQGRRILTCGNGGSAATALHFAADLNSLGIPAMDMLSIAKVMQLSNDKGFPMVFAEQAKAGDLVLAFSCSGNSANIMRLWYTEACVVLFTGRVNEEVSPANLTIKVNSDDYEIIEDIHLMMCHCLKKMLKHRMGCCDCGCEGCK